MNILHTLMFLAVMDGVRGQRGESEASGEKTVSEKDDRRQLFFMRRTFENGKWKAEGFGVEKNGDNSSEFNEFEYSGSDLNPALEE